MSEAEETIHARVGLELKNRVSAMCGEGKPYKDITAFVKEAILNQLDPDRNLQETKKNFKFLWDQDTEFRDWFRKEMRD